MRSGVVLSAVVGLFALGVGDASAFTIKEATMRSDGRRLTYSVVICTPAKATLTVKGTFTPTAAGHGARTATPSSTQYQDKGCHPAMVSVPAARSVAACARPFCSAKRGRTYWGRLVITDKRTHASRTAPRRTARA